MAAARRQPADPAEAGEPGDPDAGARPAWARPAWASPAWASPAWASTAARAPAATAGPPRRGTGSPRGVGRDPGFGAPGGSRPMSKRAGPAPPAAPGSGVTPV